MCFRNFWRVQKTGKLLVRLWHWVDSWWMRKVHHFIVAPLKTLSISFRGIQAMAHTRREIHAAAPFEALLHPMSFHAVPFPSLKLSLKLARCSDSEWSFCLQILHDNLATIMLWSCVEAVDRVRRPKKNRGAGVLYWRQLRLHQGEEN